MAEVLGLAAGGAGILTLTVQVIEKAQKFSRLIHAVKDFPEEIRSRLEEVAILSEALERRGTVVEVAVGSTSTVGGARAGVASSGSITSYGAHRRMIQHCNELLGILETLLEDIEKRMSEMLTNGRRKSDFDLYGLKFLKDPNYENGVYEKSVLDTVRVLVEKGQSDPNVGRREEQSYSVLHHWRGFIEPFTIEELKRRATSWTDKVLDLDNAPWFALIEKLVTNGSDVHAQDIYGYTALDIIQSSLFNPYNPKIGRQKGTVWSKIPSAKDELPQSDGQTPSECFDTHLVRWKMDHRDLLRWWLDTLTGAGFNLHEYAREEEAIHPTDVIWSSHNYWNRQSLVFYTFRRTFHYGQTPKNLGVSWEWNCTKMEESQQEKCPVVPGAWKEDEDEDGLNNSINLISDKSLFRDSNDAMMD
ncbi:MAG: hypothetical protein Q9167_003056 [Letrouitia subvulpina]